MAAGCQTTTAAKPEGQSFVADASPVSYLPPVQPRHHGSLWAPDRRLRLYQDDRANEPGDIVTVQIVENASAKKEANTKGDRTSSQELKVNSLGGWDWSKLSPKFDPSTLLNTSTKFGFEGEGSTDRSDTMSASIACRVVQKLPSGNLYIKGARTTRVNFEYQTISLEGIVRPSDISPDNVVLSTNIAEAKITYAGSGPVSDKQRPGWLVRLLDYVWPF